MHPYRYSTLTSLCVHLHPYRSIGPYIRMCASASVCMHLHLYVCICISVCASASGCMHLHQDACICISVYASASICVHLHQYVCICISVCASASICVHLHEDVCICIRMCASLSLCVHTCHYTCACIYLNICFHMALCASTSNSMRAFDPFDHRCTYHSMWLHWSIRSSLLQKSPIKETIFCKETNNLKEPTHRSHPICLDEGYIDPFDRGYTYGVAMICRLLKIRGRFCKRAL